MDRTGLSCQRIRLYFVSPLEVNMNVNTLLLKANSHVRKGRDLLDPRWEFSIRDVRAHSVHQSPRIGGLTLVVFRSYGCRFSRRGECTMCDFGIAEPVESSRILEIVQHALEEERHYDTLFLSPLGSMFDPYEVPPATRVKILELIARTDCNRFGCETRSVFLTESAVSEFAAILRLKRPQIYIGLESADRWILRNCIGKSSSPDDFRAKADLLRQNDIRPHANILLGAPFMSEYESLNSTVRSVRWALDNGAHLCVLFPVNVKTWTLAHWLWERGRYEPPSLWSLIETIYALGPDRCQRIALSYYNKKVSDSIKAIPNTCPTCYRDVIETLHRYCAEGDFGLVEELRRTTCTCRDSWRRRLLATNPLKLIDRAVNMYEFIACELFGRSWWEKEKKNILSQLYEDYDAARLQEVVVTEIE